MIKIEVIEKNTYVALIELPILSTFVFSKHSENNSDIYILLNRIDNSTATVLKLSEQQPVDVSLLSKVVVLESKLVVTNHLR